MANFVTSAKIDSETLARLKQGDVRAFEVIFWEYNPRVYHFVYSLLFDKLLAEDLTQTVFLKIWERREWIDPSQPFEAYLFTIARHLAYKESERMLASSLADLAEVSSFADEAVLEEKLEADSLREYIRRLVDRMPAARREIFRLSREAHLSHKEIAERLHISEKTVETQLYRALRFLREELHKGSFLALLLWCGAMGEWN